MYLKRYRHASIRIAANHGIILRRTLTAVLALSALLFLASCSPAAPVGTTQSSYTGPLPSGSVARLGKGAVNTVALSADGDLLAVGGNVGVYLYRAQTLEEIWGVPSDEPVTSVAISPDEALIAAGRENGSMLLLDADNGQLLDLLLGADDVSVEALAWSPQQNDEGTGFFLATGFNDGTMLLSRVLWQDGELSIALMDQFERDPSGITAIAFSPDQRTLAAGNRTGLVSLHETQTAERIASMEGHERAHAVQTLTWSSDGEQLVSGGRDERLIVWDVQSFSPQLDLIEHNDEVLAAAFSDDGGSLASVGQDGVLIHWDSVEGEASSSAQQLSDQWRAAAFSADGETLATASDDRIEVWATRSSNRTPIVSLEGFRPASAWVTHVAWSLDQNWLAAASPDAVVIWDLESSMPLLILDGHEGSITAMDWSPDGSKIATAGKDQVVILWDAQTGEQLLTLTGHDNNITDLAWSPDSTQLASAGSFDNTLIIWDTATGAQSDTLTVFRDGVWSVVWSPDGQMLATGSNDGSIKLWKPMESEQPVDTLSGHVAWVTDLAWAPDGKLLASAAADRRARVWDVAIGENVQFLAGHEDVVKGIAFSPGGETLATGSIDKRVVLWETDSEEPRQVFIGHADSVDGLAWSPDGSQLASGSRDGTIIIWQAGSE